MLTLVLLGGLGAYFYLGSPGHGCGQQPTDAGTRYQAKKIAFGAVTEYCLPGPSRFANGIAVAPDGSVWFGEESAPGLGHLFANGTVVEYRWPGGPANFNGTYQTGIWGVALWQGRVWGTDMDGNAVVGVDPATRDTKVLQVGVPHAFPYGLTVGPDGGLWFTTFSSVPYLGRVAPNFSVALHTLSSQPKQVAADVQFSADGTGYYAAFDPYNSSDTGVYSFDPADKGEIVATPVGAGAAVFSIDSLALGGDSVWVAQHFTSNIASFNLTSSVWTVYPTSTINYTDVTLPYFVRTQGSLVWFNEHLANKIAVLDPTSGTLTEYSESDPAVSTANAVQQDLTIATGTGGLWFTSSSGDYIGFVDQTKGPGYDVSVDAGANRIALAPGGTSRVNVSLTGTWPSQLRVYVSDSERRNSFPNLISIVPSRMSVPPSSSSTTVGFAVTAGAGTPPGSYVVALTFSDGLVWKTAYVYVDVFVESP